MRINAPVNRLSGTPVADAALAMFKVSATIGEIFFGEREALDVLNEGGTLGKLQEFVKEFDSSLFLHHLTHRSLTSEFPSSGPE